MADLDTRILRSSLDGQSEDEQLWTLMAPAWGGPGRGTRGQRALACVTYFVRDVANGGLEQALWNRDAGELAEVCEALALLGATDHPQLIREAEHTALGTRPPRDLNARRTAIDQWSRDWLDTHIAPLNERLCDEEQLYPFFRGYIARHPDEFVRT